MSRTKIAVAVALLLASPAIFAGSLLIEMNAIDATGVQKSIGTIHADDGKEGLMLHVAVKGLSPGEHGFHVHESGNCGPAEKDGKPVAGLAAGGHYDPTKAGKHEGHKGKGHQGDLPALPVDANGNADVQLVAPRLKLADLKGRSIVIHEGGDNYADAPKPLGGGGNRIACGVIK